MKKNSNDEHNNSILEIQQEEASELSKELTSEKAWDYILENGAIVPSSKEIATAIRKKAATAVHENAIAKKRRKQEIIHKAINSTFIDLNSPLTIDHKKQLISLLTQQYTDCMKKHENYINSSIEKCLRIVMPRDLLNVWAKYKDTMIPSPGFIYKASEEYGQSLTFKVTLNLPMYFEPEVCMDILKEHFSNRLPVLDKAVAFFHKHKDMRTKQEVKFAQQLTKIATFFQLVKKNAFWYEDLIKKLKEQSNFEHENTQCKNID